MVDKLENLCRERALQAYKLDPAEWGVNVRKLEPVAIVLYDMTVFLLQADLKETQKRLRRYGALRRQPTLSMYLDGIVKLMESGYYYYIKCRHLWLPIEIVHQQLI